MPEIWWRALSWWTSYKTGDNPDELFFWIDSQAQRPVAMFCRLEDGSPKFEILVSKHVEDIHGTSYVFFEFPDSLTHALTLRHYVMYV